VLEVAAMMLCPKSDGL